MQLNKFIEGLAILSQYYDKPDGYHLSADHDIIYIYPTDKSVPDADLKRLIELGFFQPDVDTDDDRYSVGFYQAGEGWAAYV